MAENSKTGLFQQKSTNDYVLLWRGQEIRRYPSIEAFVEEHELGLRALEETQAELLGSYYRSLNYY